MRKDIDDDTQGYLSDRPQQEPVAYWKEHAQGLQRDYDSLLADFQAQRTWVDLTPQDYAEIFRTARSVDYAARLAAAKLKERNT